MFRTGVSNNLHIGSFPPPSNPGTRYLVIVFLFSSNRRAMGYQTRCRSTTRSLKWLDRGVTLKMNTRSTPLAVTSPAFLSDNSFHDIGSSDSSKCTCFPNTDCPRNEMRGELFPRVCYLMWCIWCCCWPWLCGSKLEPRTDSQSLWDYLPAPLFLDRPRKKHGRDKFSFRNEIGRRAKRLWHQGISPTRNSFVSKMSFLCSLSGSFHKS